MTLGHQWDQPNHHHPHPHLTFGMQSTFQGGSNDENDGAKVEGFELSGKPHSFGSYQPTLSDTLPEINMEPKNDGFQ